MTRQNLNDGKPVWCENLKFRESQILYLRKVASFLEMDTAPLSIIEKGLRQLEKELLTILAKVLKADQKELETLWFADQLMKLVKNEPTVNEALKTISKNIKNRK
jgi:hypothetical protein